jgi:hypothetical protein
MLLRSQCIDLSRKGEEGRGRERKGGEYPRLIKTTVDLVLLSPPAHVVPSLFRAVPGEYTF